MIYYCKHQFLISIFLFELLETVKPPESLITNRYESLHFSGSIHFLPIRQISGQQQPQPKQQNNHNYSWVETE